MQRNGNRLEVVLDASLGNMYADATKVRQTLLNLPGNAAKFTTDGSVRLEVKREHAAAGERFVFKVVDTASV